MLSARRLLVLLPLLGLLPALRSGRALAAEPLEGPAKDHLAQAEFYAKKGWFADADAEVRLALGLPGGDSSFELHWLAAAVAWELLDVPRAMAMAERALELAQAPEQAQAASDLVESYRQGFGQVEIKGPQDGLVSRLQLEPTSPIFDPEQKRYVNRLSLDLRERTALPLTVGLPVGTYAINGQDLEVGPGSSQVLDLPARALGAQGLLALQVTRLEAGLGVGVLVGPQAANMRPAPMAQLSLVQPLGPVLVGIVADGSLAGYSAVQGQSVGALPTWDLGLRIGSELVLGGPLAVRPSFLYRYGRVPGVALDCQAGGAQWSCRPEHEDQVLERSAMAIYATSGAHRPGVELAIDYREAGRTTALGTGVRLVVDQAIGVLPAESEAVGPDQESIPWTAESRTWTATGIQMLAALSLAF